MIKLLQHYDMEPEAMVVVGEVETVGMAEKLAKKILLDNGKFDSVRISGENVGKVIFYDPEQGTYDLYDEVRHKIFSFIQFQLFV